MGAGNTIFAGGSLLAVTLLTSAPALAMEPVQPAAGVSSSASSLPSFFDGTRVPDLKGAWGASTPPAGPSPAPAESISSTPAPNDDAALAAAKAAMQRAEQAGREAAAVRQKAEELSRRFGTESAPASPLATTPIGVTDTAGSMEPTAALPPAAALGAPPPAEPANETRVAAPAANEPDKTAVAPTPAETTSTAGATPDLPEKKRGPVTDDKTLAPERRKTAAPAAPAAPAHSPKTAVNEAPPASAPGMKTTPGPTSKADAVPSGIGAFGWDSQPN